MKNIFILVGLLTCVAAFASTKRDQVVVGIDGYSCILNEGDEISTRIKDNKYAVNMERYGDKLTVRVGDMSSGTFSTVLFMDRVPVPTESLNFQAGNLMAFGTDNWARVEIYNLSNADEFILNFFQDATDCEDGFANER